MTTVVFDLGGVVVLWDPVPAIAAVVGQTRAEHFVHGTHLIVRDIRVATGNGKN